MANLPEALVAEFYKAAVQNDRRAEELLSAHPELINARWMHNETLVYFLAVGDSVSDVAFLAEHGADMNAVNEFGDAPLIDGAVLGFNDIAQVILRHGADPNANAGSEGRSNALDCAGGQGTVFLSKCCSRRGQTPAIRRTWVKLSSMLSRSPKSAARASLSYLRSTESKPVRAKSDRQRIMGTVCGRVWIAAAFIAPMTPAIYGLYLLRKHRL